MPRLFLFASFFALLVAGCLQQPAAGKKLFVNDYGLLQAAAERGPVEASEQLLEQNENKSVYKIAFQSLDDETVFALLLLPKKTRAQKISAAVFQPGAGVAKEGGAVGVGAALADTGFAVLVIDQRGVGETGGSILSPKEELDYFSTGRLTQQQLAVYDYLRAFDYLVGRSDVDGQRIVFVGESNGGRVAIIAAALEERAKGVLAISTAGYEQTGGDAGVFVASFDPNFYVHLIAPRRLVMMHSHRDAGIPITDARRLFDKAGEPKRFVEVECEYHGYCRQIAGKVTSAAVEIAT